MATWFLDESQTDYSSGDVSYLIIQGCLSSQKIPNVVHYNYTAHQLERFKLLTIKAQTLTAAAVEGRVLGIPPLSEIEINRWQTKVRALLYCCKSLSCHCPFVAVSVERLSPTPSAPTCTC